MKTALIIMSAAVAAGLGCYSAFNALLGFRLLGNQVMINIDVFIAFIASLGVLAGILALAFKRAVARSDENLVSRLEARVSELEARATTSERQPD